MKRGAGLVVAVFVLAFAARGAVDLGVADLVFQPSPIDPMVNPEQLRFTLLNYGPDPCGYTAVDFVLSRNAVLGDEDDQLLCSKVYYTPLDPLTGAICETDAPSREGITIPADASGEYFVFLRVSPDGDTDPDPSDNATSTNLTVSPLTASIYAVFANSEMAVSNMSVTPGYAFQYNSVYGNNWRIVTTNGGFTSTFTVPAAGEYRLKVRHLTSSAPSCPGGGYSPVTILLNGISVVTNFDAALAHGGSHGYETDSWMITAQEGDNTLEWRAGELCTHYWLQRIEITRALKFTAISRQQGGVIHLMLTGEPGRTNAIEVSTNLVDWTCQTNLFSPTGTVQWDDAPPAGSNRRFYRALGL
jgi:hypothetical protein